MKREAYPTSIWRRPWNGPANTVAWFGLLALFLFLIFLGLTSALTPSALRRRDFLELALAAVGLAALLTVGAFLVHWLCRWRNLRRLLLGIAGLVIVVVLAYAWEDWCGRRAWQQYRDLLAAKGEPLSISSLIPPAVPEEKNFALSPLLRSAMDFERGPRGLVWHDTNGLARLEHLLADRSPRRGTNDYLVLGNLEAGTFADLTACALFYRGNTNYPQAGAGAAPAQVILTALAKFDPELKELRAAAAARPESRFPIQYQEEPSAGILLPHLARVKGLTLLTHVRATAELAAGQPAEAFDDLRLGFRLADSIREEPLLIDHLVRLAALSLDLQTVREGLVRHAWSDGQLKELADYLSQLNLLAEYKHAMYGERAFETESLDFLRRQRSDPEDYVGNEPGSASCTLPCALLPSGFYYRNMVTLSRFFENFTLPTVDERSHRVSPDLHAAGQHRLAAMRRGPYSFIAKLLLPGLQNAVPKSARMQTYVDATRVACALERHRLANGTLPPTLEGLVPRFLTAIPSDVIDGKPLRYRVSSEGGFLLYSVGWNQTDEGGKLAWAKRQQGSELESEREIGQDDWVWQMAATQ